MSDQPSTDTIPPETGEGQTPSLNVLVQYVKDLSFENPGAPNSFSSGQPQPAIDIQIGIDAHAVAPNLYEVVLGIRTGGKAGDTPVFLIELSYAALISLTGVPADQVEPVLLIEGGRLLFPFARNIISDATRNGGYPPLLLNPIDFIDLYRRKRQAVGHA